MVKYFLESLQLRYPAPTDRTVYMFSRDSGLSSIPGVGFNPNHFVPLFPAENKPRDKQYSFDEKDFPPYKHVQMQALRGKNINFLQQLINFANVNYIYIYITQF